MFRIALRFQPLSVVKIDNPTNWGSKITKYIMMPVVLTSSLYYFQMKEVPSIPNN